MTTAPDSQPKKRRGRPVGSYTARCRDMATLMAHGMSPIDVARIYGITRQTAGQTGFRHGVRTRGACPAKHEESLIFFASILWSEGLSASEIARKLSTPEREITKNSLIGLAGRNRDLFPPRPSPIRR